MNCVNMNDAYNHTNGTDNRKMKSMSNNIKGFRIKTARNDKFSGLNRKDINRVDYVMKIENIILKPLSSKDNNHIVNTDRSHIYKYTSTHKHPKINTHTNNKIDDNILHISSYRNTNRNTEKNRRSFNILKNRPFNHTYKDKDDHDMYIEGKTLYEGKTECDNRIHVNRIHDDHIVQEDSRIDNSMHNTYVSYRKNMSMNDIIAKNPLWLHKTQILSTVYNHTNKHSGSPSRLQTTCHTTNSCSDIKRYSLYNK